MNVKLWMVSLALLALPGCEDLLTETPEDFIGPENFYGTGTDAIAAVNGAYAGLTESGQGFKNQLWLAMDAGSDDARVGPQVGQVDNRITGSLAYSSGSSRITNAWGLFYTTISRANDVIDRVPGVEMLEARKSSVISEARFLRALSYFYLVRLYGDVPLITSIEQDGIDVARTPADEVYAQIIQDATEAAGGLPERWAGADVGRATRGAALTLLASVHLTRGEWQQAADAAQQVIELGVYALEPNYIDAFLPGTKNGPEDIFSLQYSGATDAVGSSLVRTYYPREMGPGQGGGFAVAQPTMGLFDSFLPGDYRKEVGYLTRVVNTKGKTVDIYPHVFKYRPTQTVAMDNGDVNIPMYRYAEVLLIHAEALNELGRTEDAVSALNLIRARARQGTGDESRAEPAAYTGPMTQTAVREAIFQERRWELAHEGKRWFDLKRRGVDYFMSQIAQDPEATFLDPNDMLWPVPQEEIDLNPNLTQNPGY